MKKLAAIISIVFISISSYAQNAAAAKKMLDEVSAKNKNLQQHGNRFQF